MKHNVIAAAILGLCVILAATISSGRYYFIRLDACAVARGDRWTGKVDQTFLKGKECPDPWLEYGQVRP